LLLLTVLSIVSCTNKKNKLIGKWHQTECSGVTAGDWTHKYEFFEENKYIGSSNMKSSNSSILTTGTYKIEKDSLFLYNDKRPNKIWNRQKMTF
jgi:hypothetical protein